MNIIHVHTYIYLYALFQELNLGRSQCVLKSSSIVATYDHLPHESCRLAAPKRTEENSGVENILKAKGFLLVASYKILS